MVTRTRLNIKKRRKRILWLSVVATAAMIVVVVSLILYSTQSSNTLYPYIGQPVSPSILQSLTGVSDSTLSAVGSGQSVTAPKPVSGAPLTLNGKPEILYVGGDYCPYCAVERWSMIVALSKFGTFSNLRYTLSSSTDVYPNTATFTFSNATYSSQYVSFVMVEQYDRVGNVRQPLTQEQQALVSQYDPSGSIPFIDIANSYVVDGAQAVPNIIAGKNWTEIASQLNSPSSPIGSKIDAAANLLISAICKVDGGRPISVCAQSYATLPVAQVGSPSGLRLNLDLMTSTSEKPKWII